MFPRIDPFEPAHYKRDPVSQATIFDNLSQGHTTPLLVCFLAYAMWKTLSGWQKKAGLGSSPRTILEEIGRVQSSEGILPLESGQELRLRCVVQPDDAQ